MENNPMNETEMTGLGTPAPTEEVATEDQAMPMEEQPSKFDMETMMGNFIDMTDKERQIVGRLLASPAGRLLDRVLGEPVIERLSTQLGKDISTAPEETMPATEPTAGGMMTPAPAEEAPAPLV
jgi:hypothetical protein